MATEEESLALADQLLEMQQRIKKLEQGGRASQLSNSALDLKSGRGYLALMEGTTEKGRIGRMPDGTVAMVSVNNNTPPAVPSPARIVPMIGGLQIFVDSLSDAVPYDFGYIKVEVNDIHVGNIIKVPGSLIVSPLDTTKSHIVRLRAVNQSGAVSNTSTPMVAQPLSVVSDIKFGDITETLIADDAVTTPKIVARAITALKIAAAAVEADAIKTGAVTANKLEAILVLANRIIAGNATADRLELAADGLTQWSDKGQLLIQLGSSPGKGTANILTIVDPNDSDRALATLASDGKFTTNGLSVTGPAFFNGVSLFEILSGMPQGIQCFGRLQADSNSTSGRIGVYELSFDAYAGRLYKFATSNFFIASAGGGFPAGVVEVRYTTNGSRPTTSSTLMGDAASFDATNQGTTSNNVALMQSASPNIVRSSGAFGDISGAASAHQHTIGHDHTIGHEHAVGGGAHSHLVSLPQVSTKVELLKSFPSDCRVRVLYTISSYYGGSIRLDTPAGDAGIQFYVEDCGPDVPSTGGSSNGSGSSGGGTGNNVTTWSATWTKFWQNNFSTNGSGTDYLAQGRQSNGDIRAGMIGFNDEDIRSKLSGATIVKTEVFLYCQGSTNSTGGTAVIGTHNVNDPPTAYSSVSRGVATATLGRPEGKWITVPNSIATAFQGGSIQGLVVDHRAQSDANDAKYAMNFAPYDDATNRPKIRITYNK